MVRNRQNRIKIYDTSILIGLKTTNYVVFVEYHRKVQTLLYFCLPICGNTGRNIICHITAVPFRCLECVPKGKSK